MKKLLNQEATPGCERWVQLLFSRYGSSCSDIALYEELERSRRNSVEFRAIGTMPTEVSCNNELVLKSDYKSKTIWFVIGRCRTQLNGWHGGSETSKNLSCSVRD